MRGGDDLRKPPCNRVFPVPENVRWLNNDDERHNDSGLYKTFSVIYPGWLFMCLLFHTCRLSDNRVDEDI